ncbi:MAG: PQQ-dependent sugar dehydrogenase, partial [Phycisphaerales bacterium]|nr:PQQ-dependent sugar dehydrogenase [Phycisphaerales bacterium]
PEDNPFANREDAGRFVYSYGHRNIQGMDIDPATGNVWATEHGALGGDELNLIEPGNNYGWPKATYSIHYNRQTISEHVSLEGMVDPVCVWTPVLAASGLAFYSGDKFEDWNGDLFAGGLIARQVRRVMLSDEGDGTTAASNETISLPQRVRDVRQGPDGFLYVLTDQRAGELVRIVPD